MTDSDKLRTALVLGANGYIGNAVARAFVRDGWITYGLVRSSRSSHTLASEEILPVVGSIDDRASHVQIQGQLPSTLNAIVSTTEDHSDYVHHYENITSLLRTVSKASLAAGTKPVVIFTSGCKDYGPGPHYATDPDLAPHTEDSPIKPPGFLALRAEYSRHIFEHADVFTPVLVRPTNVHGRSSSFYGLFLEVAHEAAASQKPLVVPVRRDSICHSLHVDDCGDAYVALTSHHARTPEAIAGQEFNISARRYETVEEIARALVAEYGIEGGVRYHENVDAAELAARSTGEEEVVVDPWPPYLVDFPQWTGSDKLRRVTGWMDHRPLFTEAIHVYRVAYEAAKTVGHENVLKVGSMMASLQTEPRATK